MPDNTPHNPNGNDQPSVEKRLTALEQARVEMEDALLVHAHLESAAARRLKEHAEWLVRHEAEIEEDRRRGRALDERIDRLVSAIGEFISQQRPNMPLH